MRFTGIRIKNLGPFRDVDLDFTAIDGPLIAVTGDNGAGKSTLLELLAAALYRQCPKRGSIIKLATARDSMLEVGAVNGSRYTLRHLADAVSGSSEALVLDAHDKPMLGSTSVRQYDSFVREHFPAPEVLYASSFAAQRKASFIELAAAERKGVLLRLLQIERLEMLAKRARVRGTTAQTQLAVAQARYDEAVKRYPDPEQTAAELRVATEHLQNVQAECQSARIEHERLTERAAQQGPRRDREGQCIALRATLEQLVERIANNEALLSQRADIEGARDKLTLSTDALRTHQEDHRAGLTAMKRGRELLLQLEGELALAQARRDKLTASVARLDKRLKLAQDIARAAKALPASQQQLTAAQAALTTLDTQIEEAEKRVTFGTDGRFLSLRKGHSQIARGAPEPVQIAMAALRADTAAAKAQAAAPDTLAKLRAGRKKAQQSVETAQAKVTEYTALAARTADLDTIKAELNQARADLRVLETEATSFSARSATEKVQQQKRQARQTRLAERIFALEADIVQLRLTSKHLPQLHAAAARLEELLPQRDQAHAQLSALEAELAAMPPAIDPEVLAHSEEVLDLCQLAVEVALAAPPAAQERLRLATEGAAAAAELKAQLTVARRERADWDRLTRDLGKDGLQAIEIDAALPELSALTNDLLHQCHGPRFTVEVRTDRLNADGDKTLEDLDVRVLDTEHGRHASVESYSPGEQVIIGEAVSLALTMLACQRAGISCPTLVRDESGASLDPGNGRAYIAMLRRAAAALGADKVLFVTHNPELQDLADARIVVREGSVSVVNQQ